MTAFFLQLIVPIALLFFRFNKRPRFVLRAVGFGLLFLGLSVLWYSPTAIPFLPDAVNYFLFYLACYAFAFVLTMLCFDMPLMNLLFFFILACLVQNLSHHIFELIMRAAGVAAGKEYDKFLYLFILGVVYAVVYSLVFFFYVRKLRPEDFMRLPRAYTLAVAGAFFLVMILLGIFIRHIRTDILADKLIGVGYELYSVILDIFIISLQFGLFQNSRLRESNEQLERRLQREAKYYETAKANMELINVKCHDLKHQIAALSSMRSESERQSAIDELKEAVLMYDNIAKTGNDALDCLLTEKGLYCQQGGINFTYMADGKLLGFMKYSDIYALFGNALDNAIESVVKIEDKSKRLIGLKIFEKSGQALIHIENYCEDLPQFHDGLPKTRKSGEGHGFGMKSIRYIVKKYGGNLTISSAAKTFSLDILLPLPQ